MIGQLELAFTDLEQCVLHTWTFKWWCASEKSVQDAANRPEVTTQAIWLTFQHFRTDIVWCTAHCHLLSLLPRFKFDSKPEINDFDFLCLMLDQYISKLKISVHNTHFLHVFNSKRNLSKYACYIFL